MLIPLQDLRYIKMRHKRDISAIMLGITTGFIIWLTLLSRDKQQSFVILQPFHAFFSFWKNIQRGGLAGNFLGNIILFIPVGILLPVVTEKERWYWSVPIGFGFSFLIEVVQLITLRGCFDPDDILLNTFGVIIGFEILKVIKRFRNKNVQLFLNK